MKDEITTNEEAMADAIKFELLKRMKSNQNKPSQSMVGGKSINQIVTQGFRPLLMKHQTQSKVKLEDKKGETLTPPDQQLSPSRSSISLKKMSNPLVNSNTVNAQEESTQEFGFSEPISLREEKLEGAGKKKYGISLWKLNRGQ